MRVLKTEGIIIKRRNVGEADKLITVLTKSHGKMQVKAPGVRKIASRRSPHLELLNRSNLTLYSRSTQPIVTEAQMLNDYQNLKKDLGKIGYAYHLCEIVDGLVPEDEENESVYDLFAYTLETLCAADLPQPHVRAFELRLLELLGFGTPQMRDREYFNPEVYIESLLEKKLKSKEIFFSK